MRLLSCRAGLVLPLRLDFYRIGSVCGLDGLDPAGGVNGVVRQLPLPCALTPRPMEAPAFQFLSDFLTGNFIKKDLQPVFVPIGLNSASLKDPAGIAQFLCLSQLCDAVLDTMDFLIIEGE